MGVLLDANYRHLNQNLPQNNRGYLLSKILAQITAVIWAKFWPKKLRSSDPNFIQLNDISLS